MAFLVLSQQSAYAACRRLSRLFPINIFAALALSQMLPSVSAEDTVLHNFAGEPTDGRNPSGGMTLSNNVFYGTTRDGGSHNGGIIFRINPDGSGYTILHHFAGGTNDGDGPQGTLIVAGPTIYGTTFNGGTSNFGTVFSMDISGSNFTVSTRSRQGRAMALFRRNRSFWSARPFME
jgi:uncharacterized repeat protein (TIGR03803 family)